MNASAPQPHHTVLRLGARSLCIAALALIALAGCGSSTSSKPAYCSARAELENSIKQVSSLSPTSDPSTLQAQFQKIKTDANKLITQAKTDFPTQTSALKTSIDTLTSAVNSLTTNPSTTQIAAITTAASTAVTSAKDLIDATSSKCS